MCLGVGFVLLCYVPGQQGPDNGSGGGPSAYLSGRPAGLSARPATLCACGGPTWAPSEACLWRHVGESVPIRIQ